MTNEEITQLINNTASAVVEEIKQSGMLRRSRRSTYARTESLLYHYCDLIHYGDDRTKKVLSCVDNALKELESDEYFEIIPMIYFEEKTREQVAEYYDVDPRTISRNKRRLINKIRIALFPNDVLLETIQ